MPCRFFSGVGMVLYSMFGLTFSFVVASPSIYFEPQFLSLFNLLFGEFFILFTINRQQYIFFYYCKFLWSSDPQLSFPQVYHYQQIRKKKYLPYHKFVIKKQQRETTNQLIRSYDVSVMSISRLYCLYAGISIHSRRVSTAYENNKKSAICRYYIRFISL